jgi:hypothetical protein
LKIFGTDANTTPDFGNQFNLIVLKNFSGVNRFVEKRILDYLDFTWFQGDLTVHESEIGKAVPTRLHTEIISSIHVKTLRKVPLFQDCERELLEQLMHCLQLRIFSPNDFVCHKNEVGKVSFYYAYNFIKHKKANEQIIPINEYGEFDARLQ